jgi:hypothetical protein
MPDVRRKTPPPVPMMIENAPCVIVPVKGPVPPLQSKLKSAGVLAAMVHVPENELVKIATSPAPGVVPLLAPVWVVDHAPTVAKFWVVVLIQ